MQVLLFVFTILMAMTIMTYQRIAAFRELSALRHEYVCYMEQVEHADFNKLQKKQYDTHRRKGTKNGKKVTIDAIRYLNLYPLFAEQGEDTASQNCRLLLTHLITILYDNQSFYQDMAEKRPNFVQELIDKMIQGAKERKPKIKSEKNLSNLELHDRELQIVYTKMLEDNKEKKRDLCLGVTTGSDYDSLANYVRVSKKIQPIRIQLAPEALLMAIFEDADLVKSMLKDIQRLKNSVYNKKDKKMEASTEFERLYKNRIPKNLDLSLFNFEISSTKR